MAGHTQGGQGPDHGFLNAEHILLDEVARALQINQRVSDHLPRTVVGDLAAPVGLHHWNVACMQQMAGQAGNALRESGRMLTHPQLIGRLRRTLGSELLHGLQRGRVIGLAKKAGVHRKKSATKGRQGSQR